MIQRAHGASQRRREHGKKPEQFAVGFAAQTHDDLVESEIKHRHETEEAG